MWGSPPPTYCVYWGLVVNLLCNLPSLLLFWSARVSYYVVSQSIALIYRIGITYYLAINLLTCLFWDNLLGCTFLAWSSLLAGYLLLPSQVPSLSTWCFLSSLCRVLVVHSLYRPIYFAYYFTSGYLLCCFVARYVFWVQVIVCVYSGMVATSVSLPSFVTE